MATAPKKAAPAKKPASAKKPAATKKATAAKPKPLAALADPVREQAGGFAGKASEKARDYANIGKDKATGALDDVSEMIAGVASTVDEKVGAQYGDYVRKAASTISGVADSLKSKDVDDLVDDTRKFVKEKPAIAIGAAAALGFVLTRIFKAGSNDRDGA
jgi:ElaB/YqjD/DUF883 family membrane-anchored ribosome-binding protein